MYGIVNKAIQELIVEQFGVETWNEVKHKSGVDIDHFLSNEPYDDSITYILATTASEVCQLPVNDVLFTFGKYWVAKTGRERYGALMAAGGADLREFLINLPDFHNRVVLYYPKLMPPDFRISDLSGDSLQLHYYSSRPGLTDFVKGLIHGLCDMFSEYPEVKHISSRAGGDDHETFKITWQ